MRHRQTVREASSDGAEPADNSLHPISAVRPSTSELIQADEGVIPLYPLLQVDARKNEIQG